MSSATFQDLFIDIAYKSLKKHGEELCGDKVEILKSDDRIIAVLADGLGSGVKANILATLTSKIAITMLKEGESLEEVIHTLIATLPVCQVRKIAYSTFSILEIDKDLNCKIVESENPPFVFLRDEQVLIPKKEIVEICEKKIEISHVKLKEDDIVYIFSDGVVHAGIGMFLNLGWTQKNVEEYVAKNSSATGAYALSEKLTGACDELYGGRPGDDTTVVAMKVRRPINLLMFTGPPINKKFDEPFVKRFLEQEGKKIVCGGTVANITSRVMGKKIETPIDYIDKNIPPVGYIDGVDLVTEGVITLNRVIELIYIWKEDSNNVDLDRQDAATRLFKMLLDDCTNIQVWVGKAVNEAHQNHDFPRELSLKIDLVNHLVNALNDIGKIAKIIYISEIDYSIK